MSQKQTAHKQHIEWLRRSSTRRQPLLEDRMAYAWQVARQAAQLLREKYSVDRVRVFGSLLHANQFHSRSDIDLAVEGLTVHDYWDALADVLFLDEEITIDLVDPDTCPPHCMDTCRT
ncbi:nucleotidyltransferase family protein [Chloroflexota bacterium]